MLLIVAVETLGMVAIGNVLFASTLTGEGVTLDLYGLTLLLSWPLFLLGLPLGQLLFQGAGVEAIMTGFALILGYALALVVASSFAYRHFVND